MKEQFKFLGKICLWMVIGAAVGTLLSRSLLSESFLSMAQAFEFFLLKSTTACSFYF